MARSTIPTSEGDPPRRVSVVLEQVRASDAEPAVQARMLRQLAAWYRALAARAGNPAIWERRLLTAEDLDAEAGRIDPEKTAGE